MRTSIPWSAALFTIAVAGSGFEPAATFRASQILPASLVKGPHHTVLEEVKADGYYQEFHIQSDFGAMEAEGRTVLRTRLTEVDALARLSEVSKTETFARAAGGAVLDVGKGVAAASVFGVNGAARAWAKKLGVDPYTTNPVLHQALVDMGRIDAAASIVVKIVVPIPALVATTATVGDLVWEADPEAVRKENERRVDELGVSKEAAHRFFVNGNYTLTSQTRLIAALHTVAVPGCGDYLDAASEATEEREALFFVESAEMLTGLGNADRVSAILADSRTIVAKTGTQAVALFPFDWLRWTESLKASAVEIGGRARQELGARTLVVRLSGKATPAAKAGLAAAGWTVKDGVVAGLRVPPAE